MSDMKVTINKLNNKNYQIWKFKVEMYLSDKDVWDAVSSARPAEAAAQAAWDKKDRSARAKISLLVEDDQLIHIRNEETATDMWTALQQIHERSNLNSKLFLFRKLYGMRFNGSISMQDHLRNMLEIIDRIRGLGEEMKDTNIVAIMLCSLPDEYDSLITALEARPDAELTLEYVKGKLMDAYERRQDKFETMNCNKDTALKTSSNYGKEKGMRSNSNKPKPTKETRSCFYCGKLGHVKRNCFRFKAEGGKEDYKAKSAVGGGDGERLFDDLPVCFKTSSDTESEGWFVDSGASKHMTNNRHFFEKFTEETQDTVKIADGTCIKVAGIGHGYLHCQLNEGTTRKIEVKDVLYVPALADNLLSVRCLTDKGFKVNFENTKCKIYNRNEMVAVAYRKGHLYRLACVESARKAEIQTHKNCIHTWHRRFGHRHTGAIEELKTKNLVRGLTIECCNEKMQCTCCIKAKMIKQSFPKISTTRATRPGELIHSDICGPMKTTTPAGNRYILTLIDDYSRYLTVCLLKSKDETAEKIREFVSHLKNRFGSAPVIFRTDGGGEYVNKELQSYFLKEGILHQITVSYSPEQNGVAERRNRYLTEMARCMLRDADLENLYWGEAISTAAFLQNRLPTSACKSTPFEMWHGRKPNVAYLRTFGSRAFYLIPEVKRSKLDNRGKEAILIGYSAQSKGYRLLDKETMKVIISRSVTFVESNKGFVSDSKCSSTTVKDSEVEIDDRIVPENMGASERDNELRRSNRENKGIPPERFICAYKTVHKSVTEPSTWEEMNSLPDGEKKLWLKAADEEMKALEEKDVWKLESLPKGKKAIDCKWIFKLKQNKEGNIQRYKARLVARGFTQKPGEDFTETYAPVATTSTLRTLLTIASDRNMKVVHFDVETAFLNGEIEEELYINQPQGYIKPGNEDKVLKLKRGLYGLKQGAKAWNDKINEVLVGHGYSRSETDKCLYSKNNDGVWIYLLVYVDDVIVCVPNFAEEENVMRMLNKLFKSKNLGEVAFYLVIQIDRNVDGQFLIHQTSKIRQLIGKYGMENAKPAKTPMLPEYLKDCSENSRPHPNVTQYREAMGGLLYLSTTTRPDIMTAVGILCRKISCPTNKDWEAAKQIMRYLKNTENKALKLGNSEDSELIGYVDSDWGGDLVDRKSTSGYVFRLGTSTIMWSSRKQTMVALSSSEAEYIAMSNSCRELLWLLRLLKDFNVEVKTPVLLNEDNQSCIKMVEGEKINQRCRHIDIKYHHVRDLSVKQIIKLIYCPTEDMLADLMTKPLGNTRFQEICKKIGLVNV